MHALRSRKSNPHRCPGCGASFEVTYLDDRKDERALLPMASLDVPCPSCGRTRSVTLPGGAERTVRVEAVLGTEADEGGGG